MKVSVIVAVYKDVDALALIVESLKRQTYKNFELIVAEDGKSEEMKAFIRSIKGIKVKHTTQEDKGVRKARSQNNAVLEATGEYLIFIDGDCIPFKTFIEGHVSLNEKGYVLSGRRVNIPVDMARKIRDKNLDIFDIEDNLWKYWYLFFNKEARFRQALHVKPYTFLYKLITLRNISTSILGCNFSCFKMDMIAINGFDESYGETAIPDDMDLEWRFQAYGLKIKSCKNVANMFHLNHKIHDRGDATPLIAVMQQRKLKKKYICKLGLNTHEL